MLPKPSLHQVPSRRGSLTLELLLIAPVLLGLIAAIVEMSLIMAAQQRLTAASRAGARVAALGGTEAQVIAATQAVLGTGSLSQAQITAVVTDSSGNPLPSGSPVSVTVSIRANLIVPDITGRLLGSCTSTLVLTAQTVMIKE
jgi:Flp pilus assembly protein TadG